METTSTVHRLPMTYSQLKEHARWIAENHRAVRIKGPDLLLPRLAQNEAVLLNSYRIVEDAARAKQRIVPAATWLLDNFYVLEEQIWMARSHLPKSYSLQLPRLTEGELAGYPRVYELVHELIQYSDGLVDENGIGNFVDGYQEIIPLLIGELWAVPVMLRFALIQNARQTAARIATAAIDRHNANFWAEKIIKVPAGNSDALLQVMAELTVSRPRMSIVFMAELARRLQASYPVPVLPMSWLQQHFTSHDMSFDSLFLTESQQEASDQVSMSHAITSLRVIESIDWRPFVEERSSIDQILAHDPQGTYKMMDFATRDRYRHAVEDLAKRYSDSETAVAQLALTLANNQTLRNDREDRRTHIGYYLIGRGRAELESKMSLTQRGSFRLRQFVSTKKTKIYFLIATAITLTLTIAMWQAGTNGPMRPLTMVSLIMTTALVASQAGLAFTNWCATLIVKPRRLPRMDFSQGIPDGAASMVVVPTMLTSPSGIDRLLLSIEVNYLGNRDKNLNFALLTDFLDARIESCPEDSNLLEMLSHGINNLNLRYGTKELKPFYLFHRPRKWNPHEQIWMGYERKRGKLMELAGLLRGGSQDCFSRCIGNLEKIKNVRYIITLDTDTRLPHDAAKQLIAAMAHPLNKPAIDTSKGRVVDGYAILQPRVAVDLQCANRTWFTKLFSGEPGIDPYTREISDVYQDLFGEGSFIGKGIFEVDAFLETLSKKFPENWILSHDLIESCIARSGLISDVILHEEFPAHYQSDLSRRHRWIRGDWQISPWLLPRAPQFGGQLQATELSGLSRWKIADNLRRSIIPVAMLLMLGLGWSSTPKPFAWAFFVVLVIFLPNIIGGLQKIIMKPRESDWYSHLYQSSHGIAVHFAQSFLTLIFLPYEAWRNLDAICRSIFRMTIGKRHLLEWRPAHEVEHSMDGSLRSQFYTMGPIALLSCITLLVILYSGVETPTSGLFLSLWITAPFAAWLISQPIPLKTIKLSTSDNVFLRETAKNTWKYFEKYVTAKDNWLPPDNVQMTPEEMIAQRTSPTNIGLYLLSCLAAFDFGFITLDELLQKIQPTLATMEKLERYNGHFLNWYDTRSLQPLAPLYVSTVDSGNLTACLFTLAIALEQISKEKATTKHEIATRKLLGLAERARNLGTCDYRFLYNKSRRLLAIGYNVQEQRLDLSYYDLLASEARLASLFGIALGQLPVEHWFALGRLMNRIGSERILLSWSGSMFEYLMPLLILPDFEDTILSQTHKAAVKCQIEYGKIRNVPWGFSESGYFATDAQNNYQYRAFGVPGLGFKRGLGNDLVVAPYASMLALTVDPIAACENLRRLEAEGFTGEFGFYEAIDYTPGRIPPHQPYAIVRSFMAHHQGMGFLGLAHFLLEKPIQRRFLKSPLFQSVSLLLEEGRPKTAPFPLYGTEAPEDLQTTHETEGSIRILKDATPLEPSIQLLSNGQYHVMIGSAGEGYSAVGETQLNRYRADTLQRSNGIFCYVRNISTGQIWSTAYQPTRQTPKSYEVIFTEGKAEFKRRDGTIETHTEIAVSPEHNLEIRRIHLTNRGIINCTIELTSYMEVSLMTAMAEEAHPAFNKLFLKTEIVPSHKGIVCNRRPRSDSEPESWAFHSMAIHGAQNIPTSYETNRSSFIGRGRDIHDPISLEKELSGEDGFVLDPIFSIRKTVTIKPFESITIDLIVGHNTHRDHCLDLMASFREKIAVDRVFEVSWAHSQIVLQQLNIGPSNAQLFNRVAGYILNPHPAMRASQETRIESNLKNQSGLWGYGVSGDLPIILLRISLASQIPLLRELVVAHTYWRRKGLATDFIIWNEDDSSYRQQLHDEIQSVIAHMGPSGHDSAQGGIFTIRPDQILEDDRKLILSSARIVINAQDGISLSEHILRASRTKREFSSYLENKQRPAIAFANGNKIARPTRLPHMNPEGNEFVIPLPSDTNTPLPWVNVIANPNFGSVISERGASYTWYENAHEFRLTPWYNDPVSDPSGEAFYIQDTRSGRFWSPTPWPTGSDAEYVVRHGFGYSVFEHESNGIKSETWVYVDAEDAVKYVLIRLENLSGRRRNLTVTGISELVLGDQRSKSAMHIITDIKNGIIFARNPYLIEGSDKTSFFSASGSTSWSVDRRETLGELRDWKSPAAMQREHLSGRSDSGLDPCAALRVPVDLEIGASSQVVFTLGAATDYRRARELAKIVTNLRPAAKVLRSVRQLWKDRLVKVTIETPNPSINALANGWLLYQTMASRLFARSGFYQSGGAYGFRDQLQDVMALVHSEPALAREHILRCAEQQFPEGDVQHWWHPPSGRGIRTSFSDDYLWLPYVTAHYVRRTGDYQILDQKRNFIEGRLLKPGEESHYSRPNRSENSATLYEHCLLAISNGLKFGKHGLPLMGCGDWNDGMNLVGIDGRGESVWLGFFLYDVLRKFRKISDLKHDTETSNFYEKEMTKLKDHLDQNAWDGAWYLRAFFDNGAALGSNTSDECKIDLLPQAWAVLSGAGDSDKSAAAMRAVNEKLVKRQDGLIQLFDPPFENTQLNPGYIKGYPPGIRENGGQYTHAAIWAIWAFAEIGDHKGAWDMLDLINPLRRSLNFETLNRYKGEPYVVAADVYSKPPHTGRAGWTWYTGAAGWMYQLILEGLLGILREGDYLRLEPKLHPDWPSCSVQYRFKSATYRINIQRKKNDATARKVFLDGAELSSNIINLMDDDKEHIVNVEVNVEVNAKVNRMT